MLEKVIKYIPPAWFLFLVPTLLWFFSAFRKNNNFFDVRNVFKQHFLIFKKNKFQIIIYYVLPILVALGIVKEKLIDKDIINNLNLVLSIFISMFFAMLSILCSLPPKEDSGSPPKEDGDRKRQVYNQLLKETCNTILFECIICILLLVISFITLFVGNFDFGWVTFLLSLLIYYLMIVAIMDIFIIIKRIQCLFDKR